MGDRGIEGGREGENERKRARASEREGDGEREIEEESEREAKTVLNCAQEYNFNFVVFDIISNSKSPFTQHIPCNMHSMVFRSTA